MPVDDMHPDNLFRDENCIANVHANIEDLPNAVTLTTAEAMARSLFGAVALNHYLRITTEEHEGRAVRVWRIYRKPM